MRPEEGTAPDRVSAAVVPDMPEVCCGRGRTAPGGSGGESRSGGRKRRGRRRPGGSGGFGTAADDDPRHSASGKG